MILLRNFSLRVAIQSIFISIFVILISILIGLSTFKFSQYTHIVTNKTMSDTAMIIVHQLELELSSANASTKITKALMESDIIHPQNMIDYTYNIAKNLPHYLLKYPQRVAAWADVKGNSIATFLEPDGSYSTLILRSKAPPANEIVYRNQDGLIIKRELTPINYDPRVRPWYLAAMKAKNVVWTDVFISFPYKNLSIASTTPIYGKNKQLVGVFEIDVKLIGLINFLSTLKVTPNSQLFIVNDKNEVIVFEGMQKNIRQSPSINTINELASMGKPWIATALQLHTETNQKYFRYKYDGIGYLAYFQVVPQLKSQGLKVGIVIPENDFLESLKKINTMIIIFSFIILILGILLTRFFSQKISSSLKLLVKDTEQIRNFNLDLNQKIQSHISEISYLADAMHSMKTNLKSFQKYVPMDLVRQLIQSGEDAGVGGVNKNITAFFCDIRNFTTISESIEPEQLMQHLGEYFEELSKIISNEQGTIDKYIGDSIMAFWGAPLSDENHCIHACNAALKCQIRLTKLNSLWKKQNKPQFITGIGIHTGIAIVGNIGSSTRLNYTAMGDNINVTSRLEALSKKYGSAIIVSEDVVKAVKEKFVFKFIDCVEIRGKAGKFNIYELISKA